MIKINPEVITYWLSFSMEGRPNLSYEENGIRCKADRLVLLGLYDDVRPSTEWFIDINDDLSKGYLGWRE